MRRRGIRWLLFALAAGTVTALGAVPDGSGAAAAPAPEPLGVVVQEVLRGDLVMAGNSNLVSAGGWSPTDEAVADVDGDRTRLCVGRIRVPALCGESSSSALLDVPPGARIVAARLYVNTTVSSVVSPVRVRLDGPAPGSDYAELTAATPGIPKVRESIGRAPAEVMRQAVWDVTAFVGSGGGGSYTVADIAFQRAGAYLPYASWTIVAAYELDPDADISEMAPEQAARFARRAVTWADGFVVLPHERAAVVVDGLVVPAGAPVFATTFHLAAHARHRGPESLLFAGQPLGNNTSPADGPPPPRVVLGADPACNSTTDVLNDSICRLGSPVTTKEPAVNRSSRDGRTPSSGSGVDFDVIRVPERYLVPGTTSATLVLESAGGSPVAVGMMAASVDLPPGDEDPRPRAR